MELLVQALSESALDARRRGEPDPLPADRDDVYQAAVTMMMRVVFLLFAEERGLLPQTQLFTGGYGISDELDTLDQRARDEGAEALDRTHLTWHRLLATSQALYRGASFEDIRIPSYGGSLFDPDRFSFLTTRDAHDTLAVVVSDRVMLEVLRAAQMAELRGEPARRISFRDIDVEQIGYIYEGLLGYSCADVDEVIVGLIGKKGEEPEIPLSLLEDFAAKHSKPDALANAIINWAKTDQPAAVPPSKAALAKAIKGSAEIEDADRALRAAVPTDPGLRERLRPFIGAIRRDLRDRPTVFQPGGLVVVETPSRATAGAHYTPKSLATEVVQHALEPLVYSPGPHQEPDQKKWVPVDSDRILELKVADIACGSGAFLVAAARYLSARLVEAWQRQDETGGMTPRELELHAMREVIAKCLYGADINAMAVEMCKLSLWLVSLDPKLPFSFVDDKILHGNSLLGLTDVKQLRYQHIDPGRRAHPADPQRDRRRRRAPGGRPAAAQPRQRGQQRRPAALRPRQAPPVAAVPAGHRRTHRRRRRHRRRRPATRRQAGPGAQRRVPGPGDRPRRGVPGQRPVRQRARPHQARRDPGGWPHAHGRDRLRPVEAAALDHRRPGRHGDRAASTPSSATRRSWGGKRSPARWAPTSVTGSSSAGGRRKRAEPTWLPSSSSAPCRLLTSAGQPWPDRDKHDRPRGHARSRTRPDGCRWVHDYARHSEPIVAGSQRQPGICGGLGKLGLQLADRSASMLTTFPWSESHAPGTGRTVDGDPMRLPENAGIAFHGC